MSLIGKKEESGSVSLKKYAVPAYIIVSALIIIYVIYNMIMGGVYNVGAQQGYQTAISELIKQTGEKCEPVAITLGDKKVEVVNVACLKQESAAMPQEAMPEKSMMPDSMMPQQVPVK